MTRARPALAAFLFIGAVQGADADGWLVANKCRLDDCYLKWVTEIVRTDEDIFRVAIVTVDWKGIDDPPVYEEPQTSAYSVSCRAGAAYIEDGKGRRVTPPGDNVVADADEDHVAVWNGVCRNVRETLD